LLLVVATAAWCMAALVLIAPWVLPDFWLERGICELGSSMGVTATALLLCRMLDPHNETPVLASFCYKQSLHVLIVGGGIFTSSVVPMLAVFGVWPVLAITVTCFVLCSVGAYCLGKSQRDSRDAAAPRSLGQKSSAFVSVSARRSLSSRSSWGSMENGSELLSGE
jgi:ESS family glutamate:Na+ symporter